MNVTLLQEKIKQQLDATLGTGEWTLTNSTFAAPYSEKLDTGKYLLALKATDTAGRPVEVASFELHPMINCCGICVSTRAEVELRFRGKGLGTLLNNLRMDIARYLGYGLLLCTDIENNEYQRKILQKNGWRDIHKFVNPRTKNTVFISCISL